MPRLTTISSGILNIRINEHSPESYMDLINDLYKLKRLVKLHGDRHGVLSMIDRRKISDEPQIFGVISTFIKIEQNTEWFDTSSLADATDEMVSEINIPQNLCPNRASFYFTFDPKSHLLYFQNYSEGKYLSHRFAKELFSTLCAEAMITNKYGPVRITIKQSREGLKQLFKMKRIKKISVTIEKPNPDIFDEDLEANVEAFMNESNTGKVELAFNADKGQSVQPNESIRRISQIALSNGRVDVRGDAGSGMITQSSADHPEILRDKFDKDLTSEEQAFRSLVYRRRGGMN